MIGDAVSPIPVVSLAIREPTVVGVEDGEGHRDCFLHAVFRRHRQYEESIIVRRRKTSRKKGIEEA